VTVKPVLSYRIVSYRTTAQCMQKKTFRSVSLLESLCKIVEFIYKICS